MKTLLTTTALVTLLAAGPALAQSDTAPPMDQPPATTQEMVPDPGIAVEPPAATDQMAPDATVPEVAPDQNLTDTQPVAPVAPLAATEVYIGEQATEEDLASNWIGKTLYNAGDENLGSINDILISSDGQIRAVIIGVGGFLGIGQKDVAVSFAAIEPRTDADGNVTLYLNATQEQLEAAPEFKTLADLEAERRANEPPVVDPMAPAPAIQ